MIGKKFWCAVLVTMLAATTVLAQTALDGTIAGKVIDSQGLPVPGATVTVSSPALIQTAVVTTGQDGRYRAIRLPVGIYTVQVEMDGFNTVQREEIALAVGQSLEINVPLQLSAVAEVITVAGEQPVIDSQQVKNVQTITKEVVDQLPLARDARTAPTQLVPGVVERTSSGSQRNEEAFLVDGANMNDPDVGYGSARLSWDAIEEIEFITTSNPAENYGTIGGVINIVTRSGSNDFRGMASYYFTNKNLSQILLPTEDSQTAGVGEPSQKEFERDISFRLSGPVMKDSLWFVANYRTFADEQLGSFVPVTIRGRQFENYNAIYDHTWVFAKLTAQFSPSVRWFGSYNYSNGDRPNEFSVPCCRTLEATRHWAAKQHAASSQLLWTLSDRTLIDARFGYMHFKYTGLAQDGTENNPHFFDEFSGYSWGRLNFGSDATDKKNYNVSAGITHFVDDWGGSHEFKAGVEYQDMSGGWFFWAPNSVGEWSVFDEDLYYYRGLLGLDGPDPVLGDGRITFMTSGTETMSSGFPSEFTRVGGFVSDVWRVNDRLTLNLGIRYDNTKGNVPDITKPAADPLAVAIGEAVMVPRWGINPFGPLSSPGLDDRIPWKGFSGNLGLAYDLTGDGLTILKASYARYQERLWGWHFDFGAPSGSASYPMNWFDLNGNQQLDLPGVDRYEQANNASPVGLLGTAWHNNIDPDLKTPYMHEYRAGIERQLGDFNVGVSGIFRDRKNQTSDLLYDLETGEYWSGVDSGYWIPFNTVVPEAGSEFPAVPVTMYFQSADAPARFTRLTNVPQELATSRYAAFDITVNRRWKGDYMLGGSVVFSKNYGTYSPGGASQGSTGRGQFQDPNFLVNRDGSRFRFDRPVVFKFWGSVMLPGKVRASFNLIQLPGEPWNRTVTVQPPAEWAAAVGASTARQSVWLEPNGTRRNQSTTNLDLRFEKLFRIGENHEIGLFADIFNFSGFQYLRYRSNPGGTWAPVDENTTEGTYSPSSTRATSQVGVRTVRFSIRYSFN